MAQLSDHLTVGPEAVRDVVRRGAADPGTPRAHHDRVKAIGVSSRQSAKSAEQGEAAKPAVSSVSGTCHRRAVRVHRVRGSGLTRVLQQSRGNNCLQASASYHTRRSLVKIYL